MNSIIDETDITEINYEAIEDSDMSDCCSGMTALINMYIRILQRF